MFRSKNIRLSVAITALIYLFIKPIAGEQQCSQNIIPDLNGAWLCNDNWIVESETDGNAEDETMTWTFFYQFPKFYAISKIRTQINCENYIAEDVSFFSASIWDEMLEEETEVKLTETDKESWLPVTITDILKTTTTTYEYSGFSQRAPYWRFVIQTTDLEPKCKPVLSFFARAGIAAQQHIMNIAYDIRADISAREFGEEVQSAETTNTCNQVNQPIPYNVVSYYRLDTSFYKKHTSAYGIPILSSYVVDDKALQRACYVVRFMLADRKDLRDHMFNNKGRVAIIGRRETVPMVPEMRQYTWWTRRAAGGTYSNPVNVGAEENMLCEPADGYAPAQDIFMHEFAHGIHLIACYTAISGFNTRLQQSFNNARANGLWRNTYANTDNKEYFAEGVQAYFGQQREGPVGGDGIQNNIDTRAELRKYDPTLYTIIAELFPCNNKYIPRCNDRKQEQGLQQTLNLNCNTEGSKTTTRPPVTETVTAGSCQDSNTDCSYWASTGECKKNPSYMLEKCKKSCNQCSGVACADSDINCPYWLSYCSNNSYVKKNCKKTCRLC